jgi:phage terminase large subunit GpA-like protein
MHLPENVLLVTVSIDVQARYVAVLTAGWNEACELWCLDYENVAGDPRDPALLRSVVEAAHQVQYEHPAGVVPVHLLGCDSRYLTDSVHAAVGYGNRLRGLLWAYATAGVGGRDGEPIILQAQDTRGWRREVRGGRRPLLINADQAKHELAAMLQTTTPGRGYVHIPKRLGRDFLNQLTAEEARTKIDRDGVAVGVEWKRKGEQRNEALDTAVIALALFYRVTKSQWLQLLTARHGNEQGLERWRVRYPGERIVTSVAPPRRPSRWLSPRPAEGGWRSWGGY